MPSLVLRSATTFEDTWGSIIGKCMVWSVGRHGEIRIKSLENDSCGYRGAAQFEKNVLGERVKRLVGI